MTHAHAKREGHNDAPDSFAGHETEHQRQHQHLNTKTPSWFAQDPVEPVEDVRTIPQPHFETPNTEAYEAYRRHLETRFREAQKIYDVPKLTPSASNAAFVTGPTQRRPTMPVQEINGRKRLYEMEQENQIQMQRPVKNEGFPFGRMALFGSVAICIGATAGLGFSNFDLIKQKTLSSIGVLQTNLAQYNAKVAPTAVAEIAAPKETVITKKSVATATLDVNDVRGNLNSMIPLMLSAQSADDAEPISLKISGLPPTAYLTAGVQTAQGSWTLKPNDIPGVKLIVPQSEARQFAMEVAAVEDRTGSLAAPIKELSVQIEGPALAMNAPSADAIAASAPTQTELGKVDAGSLTDTAQVMPVSAIPDTAVEKPNLPSPIPAANSETRDLVAKGNVLLESGDIISARQFYLRAAELGEPRGSFGVGRSYDPMVFAKLNVVGLKPDAALATQWYKKAADAGVVAANQ